MVLLQVLLDAYTRCVNVLNNSSKPEETPVQVAIYITKCFTVAAQFPGCRERMVEMKQLVYDLCRILYFKVSFSFTINFEVLVCTHLSLNLRYDYIY